MENKEYPRFTVIIPQKNRAEYLIHTLKTCMIQDYPNFEIIVGDDCSDDNSVEVVRECMARDARIKLIAHDHHVGMRDNFEIALSAVKPGYVMALGGDDGLVPGCIWKMYEVIKETGTQLLTWPMAGYKYPETDDGVGIFSVRREKFKGYKYIKSKDFLNEIAHTFHYLVDTCPMFYVKGVASTELVDRVKSRTKDGCFYYCPTPDGFSGVVLAGEVEEYVFIQESLSINGSSPKSQGLNYKRTDEQSRKESEQFFNDNIRRTMHSELASQQYSPLVTLMTADYLLTAKDLPGWPGHFEMFTYESLLRKTFGMLETNPFANDVLERELKIIKEIAKQHNIEPLFNSLMKNTKRRLVKNNGIDGFFITRNVYEFNAKELGINNIYDAALALNVTYNLCNKVSLNEFSKWIKRVFRVLINTRKYKVEYLPQI